MKFLHTMLLQVQYESVAASKLPPGVPKDLQETDHHLFNADNEVPLKVTIIDFEAHKLDGAEAELTYDPIELIQQSRQARETARRIYGEGKVTERAQHAAEEAHKV